MKLSNRKQLLNEADMELKRMQKLAGLLNEERPARARPQSVKKIENIISQYDSILRDAVEELKRNKADMKNLLNKTVKDVEAGKGNTIKQKDLRAFWLVNVGSPVNKLLDTIQEFVDTIQDV